MFRRVDASRLPPPRFYIKGSYVLDVLFGRFCAKDIDFFYLDSCEHLTATDAKSWLDRHNFPQHRGLDLTRVDSIEDCSGGGFPEFNIDRWHIRDDGKLYTLEDTEYVAEYGGLFGRSPFVTRVVPIDAPWAKQQQLSILFPPYLPSGTEGLARVLKALRKMSDHEELLNVTLQRELESMREILESGGEIEVPTGAGGADDIEVEL